MENISGDNLNISPLSKDVEVPRKKDDLVIILKNCIGKEQQNALIDLKEKSMSNLSYKGLNITHLVDTKHIQPGYKYVSASEYRMLKQKFSTAETKLLCQQIEAFRSDEVRGKIFMNQYSKEEEISYKIINNMNKHFSAQEKIIDRMINHKIPDWFAQILDTDGQLFQQITKFLSEKGLINQDTTQAEFLSIVLNHASQIENQGFLAEGCKHVTLKEWVALRSKYNTHDTRRLGEYIDETRQYKHLSSALIFKTQNEEAKHLLFVEHKEKIADAIIKNKIPKWFPKLLATDKAVFNEIKEHLITQNLVQKNSPETEVLNIIIDHQKELKNFVDTLMVKKSRVSEKLQTNVSDEPVINLGKNKTSELLQKEKIERNIDILGKQEKKAKPTILDEKQLMFKEFLKKYPHINLSEYTRLSKKCGENNELFEKVCAFINQARQDDLEDKKDIQQKKSSFLNDFENDGKLSPSIKRKTIQDEKINETQGSYLYKSKIMQMRSEIVEFLLKKSVPQWFQNALDPKDKCFNQVKDQFIESKKVSKNAKDIEVLYVMLKNRSFVEDFTAEGYKHLKIGELENIYSKYDQDQSKKIGEWIDFHREIINLNKENKIENPKPNILIVALLHKNAPTWMVDALGGDNIIFDNIKRWLVSHKLANEKDTEVDILFAALENKEEIGKELKKLMSVIGLRKVAQILQRDNQEIGRIDPKKDKDLKDWEIVGEKKGGIEPGFIAKKRGWSEKHIQKILKNEKYMSRAISWVKNKYSQIIDMQSEETLRNAVENILQNPNHPDFAELMQAIRTNYIFKLNYADPSSGSEIVKTDLERIESDKLLYNIPVLSYVTKQVHSGTTSDTRRNKNLGAVIECFSNDIYRALGLRSQDLYIVPDQYKDGKPKLLLAAKHITGKKGESFHTFEESIENGHLKENHVKDPLTGKMVPINTHGLAQLKLLMLLMGDHDKIGVNGGNVGYVVEDGRAEIVNIDPGKSLENSPSFSQEHVKKSSGFKWMLNLTLFPLFGQTDKMTFMNIHEDFSSEDFSGSISNRAKGGYRNISICNDLSYVEQMQVLREVRQKFQIVEKICKQYIDQFGEQAGDLNFAKELSLAYERLTNRAGEIFKVFEKRINLSDEQLNMVEGLEKLCSPTESSWIDSQKQKINFEHLQIVPGKRVPWNFEEGKLVCQVSTPKEAVKLFKQLQEFMTHQKVEENLLSKIKLEGNKIIIDDFQSLSKVFSPEVVKEYKQK